MQSHKTQHKTLTQNPVSLTKEGDAGCEAGQCSPELAQAVACKVVEACGDLGDHQGPKVARLRAQQELEDLLRKGMPRFKRASTQSL